MALQAAKAVAPLLESQVQGSAKPSALALELMGEGVAIRRGQLRCRRRRGRAEVGHKIRNADIALMAHRGHHGNGAGHQGPGNPFVVEGPEVF